MKIKSIEWFSVGSDLYKILRFFWKNYILYSTTFLNMICPYPNTDLKWAENAHVISFSGTSSDSAFHSCSANKPLDVVWRLKNVTNNTYKITNDSPWSSNPLNHHLKRTVWSVGGLVPAVAPLYSFTLVLQVYLQVCVFVLWTWWKPSQIMNCSQCFFKGSYPSPMAWAKVLINKQICVNINRSKIKFEPKSWASFDLHPGSNH